jgi:hypothetical protein
MSAARKKFNTTKINCCGNENMAVQGIDIRKRNNIFYILLYSL